MNRLHAAALALAVVALALLLLLPLGAGASSNKRFALAIRGTLDGDASGAGTFSADGAISDSGTFSALFTATPAGNNCYAIAADWTFTTPDGNFTFHGSGRSCSTSPNDARAISDFAFKITKGSGAYAGISGGGSAIGVTDFNDGTFTTVFDGKERLGR